MSSVAIPEMKKYNYHPMLNAGSVAAGATLGVLIPPSIVLVVYGLYTGQSIGKLFFGNVIPSAILTVAILGTVVWICRALPPPREAHVEEVHRFDDRNASHLLHGLHDRRGGGDLRAVPDAHPPPLRDRGVDPGARAAEMDGPLGDPALLHHRRLRHGR